MCPTSRLKSLPKANFETLGLRTQRESRLLEVPTSNLKTLEVRILCKYRLTGRTKPGLKPYRTTARPKREYVVNNPWFRYLPMSLSSCPTG